MTYRSPGNDPNRQRDIPTPDEVRAMVTGAGVDGFQASNRFADGVGSTLEREAAAREGPSEKMVWLDCNERTPTESRALAEREQRCATCGLRGNCWCDQPCAFCKYPPMRGTPKKEVS